MSDGEIYSRVDPTRKIVTGLEKFHRHKDRQREEAKTAELAAHREEAPAPPNEEAAYRRGFAHGVQRAIDAMLAGASLGAITKWAQQVTYWRHDTRDQDKPTSPPVAPPEDP